MNPASLEVYCGNEKCGDPESGKHSRMNYMGKRRIGAARSFLTGLVMFQFDPGVHSLPPGKYHIFRCSVCNRERIYREHGDQLTEV